MKNDRNTPLPEFGSAMHLLYPARAGADETQPPFANGLLFASGRDALLALYASGLLPRSRLWMPDYFCSEVRACWARFGGELRTYSFGPWNNDHNLNEIPAQAGDTVLLVNTLGLFGAPDIGSLQRRGVRVIEDHTHDPFSPWARHSRADWCIASLRKSLPLPDGGALWSPTSQELPVEPTLHEAHELAALRVLAAMGLKRDYLETGFPPKALFRALYLEGESKIGFCPPGAALPTTRVLLADFPHEEWRQQRWANWQRLAHALEGKGPWRIVSPKQADAVPFGLMLTMATEKLRNELRGVLHARQFYTAVLWDLEENFRPGVAALSFSRCSLVLSCDGRYRVCDLDAMARLVAQAGTELV